MAKQEILNRLAQAVIAGSDEDAASGAQEAIASGVDATEAIIEGLTRGINTVSRYYETGRYFLPEVLFAASAFEVGVSVLKPHIKTASDSPGVVVIGTVQGDTHDIGKNLVALLLSVNGYEVHDAGRDVTPATFVSKVRETGANILGLSALMTTSMANMEGVVELLHKEGLRDKVKVLIGGAPVSSRYAQKIGADAYAANAFEAVLVANALVLKSKTLAAGVG
ncbi:MAG: corrinoid protein [Thermacetogeniaceae bacterium]